VTTYVTIRADGDKYIVELIEDVGARTVNNLVTLHKNDVRWRRSDCKWLTTRAADAANELQRDPDLSLDVKSRCEVIVFVAWVFDAVRSARAWKARQYVARSS
jgi:hypothetical protein